jgi:hypothetical protein
MELEFMDIKYNLKGSGGEIEIVFGVKVKTMFGNIAINGDVEITDVCVNGYFVPRFLEEDFINMIGRDAIEQRALENEAEAS